MISTTKLDVRCVGKITFGELSCNFGLLKVLLWNGMLGLLVDDF